MMKNIYCLLALLLSILFAGCSDDENTTDRSLLKVVSAEVSFNCKGGTGIIAVESALTITAQSTEDWCQVVVNNNTVSVKVEANSIISSRTALITISAGEEKKEIPVYQLGDIFDTDLRNADFTAKGGEVKFKVSSNWDVEVEGAAEWVTCTFSTTDQELTVRVAPLTEKGKYRANAIKVKSGSHVLPVIFTQVNMAGKYACYTNAGALGYGACLIEDTETDFLYKVTPAGSAYDAPYYAKYRNGQFVINFGQYLGMIPHDTFPYVYLCAYDKKGYLNWEKKTEYVAPVNTVNTQGQMLLIFKDSGTWSGQSVDGFYYGMFTDLLEKGGTTKGNGVAAIVDLIWLNIPE